MATYINPVNGYKGHNNLAFLWCLLFGTFYFLLKGIYKHAIISLIASVCTFGFAWLIYPFFAPSIVENFYLEKGFTTEARYEAQRGIAEKENNA